MLSLRRRIPALALTAACLVGAACAGGGDGGDDGSPVTVATTDRFDALGDPGPGEGSAVIDREDLTFEVTACADGAAADDPPEATRESSLTGTGETAEGPFTVEVTRYRSDTGAGTPAVTETARILTGEGVEARGIEAKRTTAGVEGAWLDLADPDATEPLIDRSGDAVDVRATFGPEQARAGDDGLVEGRIRARCPAP